MNLSAFSKQVEKFVADNSPAILTAISVTGTVTTAYLTGQASFKAAEVIREERFKTSYPKDADWKYDAKLVWKLYIPSVASGAVSILCALAANRIGNRRAAAMASAYSLSEKAFHEYRNKVVEKFGEHKERNARDEIAQDRVDRDPVTKHEIIHTDGGDVLCYDTYTGRYFYSSMEALKKAQNDLNYMIINHFYASLSDFYDKIGLHHTKLSDDVGWNSDELLELKFSTTMSDDGRPCISIDFEVSPIRGFFQHL